MSTADEHVERAEKNEGFANALSRTNAIEVDWAITALFYAALHYIDAYFLSHRWGRPRFHFEREGKIRDTGELLGIWPDYRRLKDMSPAARYELANYSESDFLAAAGALSRVRSHVLLYRRS
jgi:hypothetical protein